MQFWSLSCETRVKVETDQFNLLYEIIECTFIFLIKFKYRRDIKNTIFFPTFYVQTWILIIKDESKFVSEPKTAIFEVLYILTGLIRGFISYELFLSYVISWK